jgi:hypothetical protein
MYGRIKYELPEFGKYVSSPMDERSMRWAAWGQRSMEYVSKKPKTG